MKIALISDVTFEPVLKHIGMHPDIHVEKYIYSDQIVPELLKTGDQLAGFDMLIIHIDSYFYRYTDSYIKEVLSAVKNIASRFAGNILVSNNLMNGRHSSLINNNVGQFDQVLIEQGTNIEELLKTSNVYFYDVKKLITRIGLRNTYNFKLGFLYQMPYTKDFINLLSTELVSLIHFLGKQEKKAIFVDCDNTLWLGILGEDGLEGIQCNRNAKGVLFFQFQEFLLEKKREGFIIGLCSKNNEGDVKDAFEKLNMPLKWDDFIIKKVNWLNKAENLKDAANELNIGLDSFIFIDDNEFELQSINALIPEVFTVKLQNDYNEFLILCDDYSFKRKRLTKEDLEKNNQYFAELKRNSIKATVQSFESYLASLEIKMDITTNNIADFSRLSQLTEKTNQFNFNKEPYSILALEQYSGQNNLIYGLRVADKFGDYGLVGLILIDVKHNQAILHNFLLSCRALGRQIEDDFFDFVLNDLNKRGLYLKDVLFKETAKNAPAQTFFSKINQAKKINYAQ